MAKKYRKKPVVIEAVQWTGDNLVEVSMLMPHGGYDGIAKTIKIETLEGEMVANIGDYIIKGIKGEFYPCKPDIFEQTYEECND